MSGSADLSERLRLVLEERGRALAAAGEAFAEAINAEAPKVSGRLATARYVPDTATTGHIEMVAYGDVVDAGVPGSATVGPSGRRVQMRPLSQRRSAIAARLRYQQRVGHTVTHPNPFVERAWSSERVQAVLRRFPQYLVSRG